jgi:hypothetical protein
VTDAVEADLFDLVHMIVLFCLKQIKVEGFLAPLEEARHFELPLEHTDSLLQLSL